MVNKRSPEDRAWDLAARIAVNLPIRRPDTEYSTKDPDWIRYAKAEMEMLAELRTAIRDHPEEMLDAIEIMQDGLRFNFFPTKGERRQLEQTPMTWGEMLAESSQTMLEMKAADERWQRYKAQKAGTYAAVAHAMGVAAKSG